MTDARSEHRAFLNRFYGASRHFYDVSRKYYLLGRDRLLRELLAEEWSSLVEVGPGTGRMLRLLHRDRPDAKLGGVEASDEMLAHARPRCPWAQLVHGFAEDADFTAVLGERPERILFSYCLSMVGDPKAALDNARSAVAPGGEVVVVDFADLGGLPSLLRRGLAAWLRAFHVEPLDERILTDQDATLTHGACRYYVIGRMTGTTDA